MIAIETERLLLREPRREDAEPMLSIFGDAIAMRYIGDGSVRDIGQIGTSIKARLACLEEHGITLWTVVERATGDIVGDCGVFPIAWTHAEFELGYRFRPSAWGKGFATEAGRAAMEFAWGHTRLDEILGVTMPGNFASQRVLTKLGFDDLGKTDRYYNETLRCFGINRPTTSEPRA